MQEYELTRNGSTYRVQLDDDEAERYGLLKNKRGRAENKAARPEVGRVPVEPEGDDVSRETSKGRPGAARRRDS